MKLRHVLPLLALLSGLLLSASGSAGTRVSIPDFSFVHCSDVHVPPGVTPLLEEE